MSVPNFTQLGFLVVMALGCSGADPASETAQIEAACADACAIAVTLKCSAELELTTNACQARCLSIYRAQPSCHPEYSALTDCVAQQPAANWTCNTSGQADVVAGICQTEYDALNACMQAH